MNTPTNTPEEQWENVQYIAFEKLYTGFHETKEFSQLQDKLKIKNGLEDGTQIPLFDSMWFYSSPTTRYLLFNLRDQKKDFFRLFSGIAENLQEGQNWYLAKDIKGTIFPIRKCFENKDRYIFYSDLWCIYTVLKDDFNNNWFMAATLRLLSYHKWPLDWEVSEIECDGWEIRYYLKGILIWNIEWSCF